VSLKTIIGSIPVYRADGSLFCTANEERLARLQSVGLVARLVRSRKGDVKRAILFVGPGEPSPILAGDLGGTRYSFRQHLDSGYFVWTHKRLRPEVPPAEDAEQAVRAEAAGTGA
jgi:hypothetical protein